MGGSEKNRTDSILSRWKNLQLKETNGLETKNVDKNISEASFGQQRLFFINELNPENPVYNLTEIWQFNGPLDIDVFIESFELIGEQQELLRASFHLEDESIKITISDSFEYEYEYIDGADTNNIQDFIFQDIATKKARTIFNLSTGPLVNITICKLNELSHKLIINVHHIISDKWSMRILRENLSRFYNKLINDKSIILKSKPTQYSDYAQYERTLKVNQETKQYWLKKLNGFQSGVTIPSDIGTYENKSFKGAYSTKSIPSDLFADIKSYCRNQKVTPFVFFLSVFNLLIHKYSDEEDIVIGTPISTRSKVEFENIVGFFNDTIVIRTGIKDDDTFQELLSKVKTSVLEAFSHKDINYQRLIKLINPNRSDSLNPIFQVMFLYHKEESELQFSDDITLKAQNFDMGVSKFDLTLYVSESSKNFAYTFEYATDLYSKELIEQLHLHLHELVDVIIRDNSNTLSNINCLSEKELREMYVLGAGNSIDLDAFPGLLESIFGEVDNQTIALKDEDEEISYGDLDKRSNDIASALDNSQVSNKYVAILMDQSADFVIAMLGVLKAGYAYVPLDANYPVERINYILKDSGCELIITSRTLDTSAFTKNSLLFIEDISIGAEYLAKPIDIASPAYVIYTSGSTGKPNGVSISHENLINSTRARIEFYDKHPDSFLLLSSFSFDSSVAGIYWTLMNGGKLIIPKRQSLHDINIISDLIESEKITHTLLIPSLYTVYLDYIPPSIITNLKVVIVAGEVVTLKTVDKHFESIPETRLYNEYGPTEATVWSSAYEIRPTKSNISVPIGRPILNNNLYVLDKHYNFVPKNVIGQLFISGKSVSSGYINFRHSTENKFIVKNINNQEVQLYATGDRVKWDFDNQLIFCGRTDHQIKIRGHRVELGEIDAKIRAFESSIETNTVYSEEHSELVTFVVSSEKIDTVNIKSFLSEQLPSHAIPNRIIQIDAFPLMPNGKVDLKKLKFLIKPFKNKIKLNQTHDNSTNLLGIIRDVLNQPTFAANDNYFEAGGDSIQIIRIVTKAKKHGINVTAKDIYTYQTVDKLMPFLNKHRKSDDKKIIWEKLPISPIQEWFFETHKNNPNHWLQGFSFKLDDAVDYDSFIGAVDSLIQNFDVFGLTFKEEFNRWFQVRRNFTADSFIIKDEWSLMYSDQFDVLEGPLCKFFLKVKNNKVISGSIIMHHLIIDALSWNILFNFLSDYFAKSRAISTEYSDSYAKWVYNTNQLSTTNYFDTHIAYWNNMLVYESPFFSHTYIGSEESTSLIHSVIDKATSINIKQAALKKSNLRIDEVIIACFLVSLYELISEDRVTIMLERHGRAHEYIDVDSNGSIGWHTSFFPVHFHLSNPGNLVQSLLDVKEANRTVPHSGQSYGILKYLSKKLTSKNKPKITINHLGDFGNQEYNHFENVVFLREGLRGTSSERHELIELNTWIENGSIRLVFSYDDLQFDEELIKRWNNRLIGHLNTVPQLCKDSSKIYTPSDFNYAIDQTDLDDILTYVEKLPIDITGIVGLSVSQTALLFHHLQNRGNDQGKIKAQINVDFVPDPILLQAAWDELMIRHDALRSMFLWDGLSKPYQIVCDSIESKVQFFDTIEDFDLECDGTVIQLSECPLHKLICYEMTPNKAKLTLLCHHINLDGWSTLNVFTELISMYNAKLYKSTTDLTSIPSLALWKSQFDKSKQELDVGLFWDKYLGDVKPALLKKNADNRFLDFKNFELVFDEQQSKNITINIREAGITLNTFFAGVWSYLLSNYLQSQQAVIGITYSGRHLDLEGMESLVGMFSNVLPLKYTKQKENEINFADIRDDLNEIIAFDPFAVEDLKIEANKLNQQLFDTVIIVENFAKGVIDEKILFSDFRSNISTTVPFSLIIVPGSEIKVSIHYNTSLFTETEIELISSDLSGVISNVNIINGVGEVSYKSAFELKKSVVKDIPAYVSNGKKVSVFDIPSHILGVWSKHLPNNQTIGINDNFFDIGGTSMLAVRIFNQLNQDFSANASPIILVKHNTIAKLASWFQKVESEDSWRCLYPLKESGHLNPLFCFHAGEGHVLFYKDLADGMNVNRPVYGIQPVGLDGSEHKYSDIESMADFYISQIKIKYPTGPYHLLGTCFSNAVTFEMAKKLGAELGQIIIVDSPPPYFREYAKLKKWLNWVKTMNFSKLAEASNNYFKYLSIREPKEQDERNIFMMGKYLRMILSDYKWEPQDLEIALIRSSQNADDPNKSYHTINWQFLAKRGLKIRTIAGEHLEIFRGDSAKMMAHIIDEMLPNE